MSRLRTLVAAMLGLALLLTGCSAGGSGSEASNATTGTVKIDTMFGEVEVPQKDDLKVVALGWSDAEAALAVGVKPIAVYDWLSFGEKNKGVGPWATEKFGDVTPEVMPRSQGGLDYEKIQSLEPDVILNVRSSNDEAEFKKLNEIAPTVYGPQGTVAYGTPWREHTEIISKAVGKEDDGKKVVESVEQKIDKAASDNPDFKNLNAVVGSKYGDAYGVAHPGDVRWDLVSELGFSLYEPAAKTNATDGFSAPVSREQVSVFNADVAVLFPIGYTLQQLKDDPLISSLDVVKDGRAVLLDPDGELSQAFSVASPLSLPIAVDQLTPQLAEAAKKVQK